MAGKSLKGLLRRRKRASSSVNDETTKPAKPEAGPPTGYSGPSPNQSTNQMLADLALQGGSLLLRRSIERSILGMKDGTPPSGKTVAKRTVAQTVVGTAVAKLATKSVPGAIVVAGGLLALTLHERRKARLAKQEAAAPDVATDDMVEDGEDQES